MEKLKSIFQTIGGAMCVLFFAFVIALVWSPDSLWIIKAIITTAILIVFIKISVKCL